MDEEFTDDVSQNKDGMDLDEKGKICNEDGEMDVDECYSNRRFSENSRLVKNIGKVVLDLRSLGFTSMAEDAYASAIFLLLKVNIYVYEFQNLDLPVFLGLFYGFANFGFIFVLHLSCAYLSNLWVGHSSELQAKVYNVAGDDFRSSILQSIQSWIQVCSAYMLCICKPCVHTYASLYR